MLRRVAPVFLLATLATRPARALESAPLDLEDEFAVALVVRGAPGQTPPQCSGVLVASNVVVTARHCFTRVVDADGIVDCGAAAFAPSDEAAAWVTTSAHADREARWRRSRRVAFPETSELCGADVAFVVLVEPIPPSEARPVTPELGAAPLPPAFEAIAHGSTSSAGRDSGRRRQRSMPVRCEAARCDASLLRVTYFDEREILAGDGACGGDSGSGAFAGGTVLGVLSRIRIEDGRCRDAVYERLDAWGDLLRRVAVAAADEDGLSPPAWATAPRPRAVRSSEASAASEGGGCAVGGAARSPWAVLGVVLLVTGRRASRSRSPRRVTTAPPRRGPA